MPRDKQSVLEVEIRDTNDHYSTDFGSDAGTTLLEDTHHHQLPDDTATDSRFLLYDEFAVYMTNTHDQSMSVDVNTAPWNHPQYDDEVSENTFNLADNRDSTVFRISGLLGRMRFQVTGINTAPTEGTLEIDVQALGRPSR